jgi:hypothetical protein
MTMGINMNETHPSSQNAYFTPQGLVEALQSIDATGARQQAPLALDYVIGNPPFTAATRAAA